MRICTEKAPVESGPRHSGNRFVRCTLASRFWSLVCKETDCWKWTGCCRGRYGYFPSEGFNYHDSQAQRVSRRLCLGALAEGFDVKQSCNENLCVKPEHLVVVASTIDIYVGPTEGVVSFSVERPFWDKVRLSDSCWHWLGKKSHANKIILRSHAKTGAVCTKSVNPQKLSFALHVRELDPDEGVRPSCKNPECVNPAHLVAFRRRSKNSLSDFNLATDFAVSFWSKINKGAGCWTWLGETNIEQYGLVSITDPDKTSRSGSKRLMAHKVAYELTKGIIPPGQVVMHSCDNPRCVRPDHLSVGSIRDNTLDCINKGRRSSPTKFVEVRISDDIIREIRQKDTHRRPRYTPLAKEYGIHPSYVYKILNNKVRQCE